MPPTIDLAALIASRQPGHALPQAFYTDQAVFDLEMRHIWHRHWIFAGMSCEIAQPGSWFTVEIGHASVIIARGNDGAIRAFHNTCRHRGARICGQARGQSRNLTCPYHQWTYDTAGKLLFARDMPATFQPAEHGLLPVHVENLAGYLFICLADDPPDFQALRDTATPYLQPHGLEHAKVAYESTLIEQANWKLVIENNRECYHCKAGHPELMRTIADVEDPADPRCAPDYILKAQADQARWASLGYAHRRVVHDDGWQIVRVPMARGLSFTMDGQPASRRLLGELPDPDFGSARLLSFPSSWNHALADHAIAFRVLPLGPDKTAVTTKWLVHEDAVAGEDYDLETLTKVWLATNEQDRSLAENNQRGILSPAYRPGPYSAASEYGVLAFIDWYLHRLQQASPEHIV